MRREKKQSCNIKCVTDRATWSVDTNSRKWIWRKIYVLTQADIVFKSISYSQHAQIRKLALMLSVIVSRSGCQHSKLSSFIWQESRSQSVLKEMRGESEKTKEIQNNIIHDYNVHPVIKEDSDREKRQTLKEQDLKKELRTTEIWSADLRADNSDLVKKKHWKQVQCSVTVEVAAVVQKKEVEFEMRKLEFFTEWRLSSYWRELAMKKKDFAVWKQSHPHLVEDLVNSDFKKDKTWWLLYT